MTSRERMISAMLNQKPDMVPVSPDMSNMIPCKLTGKPFWDIYLYQNPPLWKAYIDAVKYFEFDGWLPLYDEIIAQEDIDGTVFIVYEDEKKIITRRKKKINGEEFWHPKVTVYPVDNPPSCVDAEKMSMGEKPEWYRPIEGVPRRESIFDIYPYVKKEMGESGVVGINIWIPGLNSDKAIYEYYDNYDAVKENALKREAEVGEITRQAVKLNPDFICIAYSGGLTFQTPDIFRDIGLPSLKIITAICKDHGIPSLMHCCGRSRELIDIVANETDLSCINPLEVPPMGDCVLSEVKHSVGKKISLMGNLHTVNVMLFGTPETVKKESIKAIDDASYEGGFILSTGDQCGRDTPFENIKVMIEVARTYGKYKHF